MQKSNTPSGFLVHNFMTRLGLTSSEIIIYAIIYSYTSLGKGLFFGTFNHLAEATGVSVRTVSRAIKSLTQKGLIERCTCSGRSGIRATESITEEKEIGKESSLPKKREENEEKKQTGMKRWYYIPGRYLVPDVNTGKVYDTPPKYDYVNVGKHKLLRMTSQQYDTLKSLIPDWELKRYVDKLEAIHMETAGRPDYWANSDYRILRRWIDKDVKI